MNDIIRQLFEIAETEGKLDVTDNMLTSECEKQLQPYRERLQDIGYEQIRDAVFAISYFSKRSAFEIGFQTAMKLILECMRND